MPRLDKRKHISEQISILKNALRERKKLSRERQRAMEEQLRAKKQLERQYSRRSAMDPGNSAPKSQQQYEFRLWSARLSEMRQEIRALEKEIDIKKREDELEIRVLEQEIDQAQAELRIYAQQDLQQSFIRLAHVAVEARESGDFHLSSKLQKSIKSAQTFVDDIPVSRAISRTAYDPKKKS
jgi:hypothetical protein